MICSLDAGISLSTADEAEAGGVKVPAEAVQIMALAARIMAARRIWLVTRARAVNQA